MMMIVMMMMMMKIACRPRHILYWARVRNDDKPEDGDCNINRR